MVISVLMASSGGAVSGIIWVLILAFLGYRIYLRISRLSPPVVQFHVSMSPDQVITASIAELAAKRRWRIITQSHDSAMLGMRRMTMTHWLIGIFLLFFFVIPGLIYLYVQYRREDTLNVRTTPDDTGTSVQLAAKGLGARMAIKPLRSALGA